MKRQQTGFTLVEIAIVLIIIALLIAGVLKGQQIIENSRVVATVAEIKSLEAGINTFKDTYNALPGDIANPIARLPNCTNYPCDNNLANGDGIVGGPGLESEGFSFFVDMAVAGLTTGINANLGPTPGGWYPAVPLVSSDFVVARTDDGIAANMGYLNGSLSSGETLYLGVNPNNQAPTVSLTAHQAAQIDTKLDDGNPATGFIRAFGNTGTGASDCGTAAGYNQSSALVSCGLYFRMPN